MGSGESHLKAWGMGMCFWQVMHKLYSTECLGLPCALAIGPLLVS